MLLVENDREVVPRWRSFRATLDRRELAPLRLQPPLARPSRHELEVDLRLREWRDHGTPSYAADLLGAAMMLGDETILREAATALRAAGMQVRPVGRSVAELTLSELDSKSDDVGAALAREDSAFARASISQLRHSLRREQRNAIAWAELARFHAIVGNRLSSRRAMHVAIDLAPHSRFVLRSAGRLSVHLEDPEWGAALLRESPRTMVDPWLTSAEISIAARTERPSRLTRLAREMLESSRFSHHDTTELAAALATREMDHSRRRARRLFEQALIDPTENVVAQVVWASRELNWADGELEPFISESSEARARTSAMEGDGKGAVSASWDWFRDEQFAVEPPTFGSYHASVDEDYEEGLALALEGLKANPSDSTLLNNAAFCLASMGRVQEAHEIFARIKIATLESDDERATFFATRGLIAYRSGSVDAGRESYRAAVATTKEPSIRALAAIMSAREEIRAGTPLGFAAAERARKLQEEAERSGGLVARDLRAWLRHLDAALAETAGK